MPARLRHCAVLVFIVALGTCGRHASADEPLRWSFTQGESLKCRMVQKTEMSSAETPGTSTVVEQILDMLWHVREVNEEGNALMEQTIDRVQMTMTGPFGEAEFDSEKDESPPGLLAMAGPIYKAMTESMFELQMTRRGEIVDVKIPESLLEAVKNMPAAAAMGEMLSEEGFQRMMVQSAMTLPEEYPTIGDSWSHKTEMTNPMFGKQIVETSYKFVGEREQDGQAFAVFEPAMAITFAGGGGMQAEVKNQQSSGEVLFNRTTGRLDSSALKLDLTLQITVAGQSVAQNLKQTIDLQVTPADSQKSDPPDQ